jgi:CRISPR-associated protein Csb2
VFQSLVAAAAARWRAEALAAAAQSALRWLEAQVVPTLVAPSAADRRVASGYCLSVPNNAMDLVAAAWCRGNDSNAGDANPATHRTMKNVRPTHLLGGDTVHYLWTLPDPLSGELQGHVSTLCDIARGMVALGWGVDMVVAQGAMMSDAEAGALLGERWVPSADATDDGLRVPARGTLDALIHRHERFLARLRPDGVFTPPPPLSSYLKVNYRRATDPAPRPVAAFSLLQVDASGFRASDTARTALTVAGTLRHAAKLAAGQSGWPEAKINAFILGHGEPKGDAKHVAVGPRRFAYLPLPSIEARGQDRLRLGSVRRGLITAFVDDCEAEITWARRTLSGQRLIDESTKQPVALLSSLAAADNVVRQYTRPAAMWATVTPVALPGHDDPAHYRRRLKRSTSADEQKRLLDCLGERIDGLLRKAIIQAGFGPVLAAHADLEWRKVGFWPGSDLADRYGVPDHIRRFPRYHVRLHWRDENQQPIQVPGPVCLGAGRFLGLGLFAAL